MQGRHGGNYMLTTWTHEIKLLCSHSFLQLFFLLTVKKKVIILRYLYSQMFSYYTSTLRYTGIIKLVI